MSSVGLDSFQSNSNISEIKSQYLGKNPKISTRFSSSLVGIIANIFSKAIHFKALKDYNSKPAIEGYRDIHKNLMQNIGRAKELIGSDDASSQKQGYTLLKELLLLKAQIDVSDFGARLRDPKKVKEYKASKTDKNPSGNKDLRDNSFICKEYQNFCDELKEMHSEMKGSCAEKLSLTEDDLNIDNFSRTEEKAQDYDLYRWIQSTSLQRKIAAVTPNKSLPLKATEVPAGAVLLTNLELRTKTLKLRGFKPKFDQYLKGISSVLIKLFTGKAVVHSEIALGNANFLHQDDAKTKGCSGITEIEDRGDTLKQGKIRPTIITHDVVIPRAERMFSEAPEDAKEELEKAIQDIVSSSKTIKVRTSVFDIIRCGLMHFFPKRPLNLRSVDYLSERAQKDAEGYISQGLSCSGTVAALYRRSGVEVGKHLGKTVEEINPSDFTRSGMFKPLFESGTFSYQDPLAQK